MTVTFFVWNVFRLTCISVLWLACQGGERETYNVQRVVETPQFLLFSITKGGTKTIAHLTIAEGSSFLKLRYAQLRIYDCKLWNGKKRFNPVRNEYSPQLSKLLYNCQFKKRRRSNTLKGSQRMGAGRIFLKPSAHLSFHEDLSNEPNFGWTQQFKVEVAIGTPT